ncbi:MAG: T9SS type A sorting domain-containing protein [Bacteroidetes bacterium]|nr:T9SS type A sorting domain-containing protein [Bacteroidota bacterium]
MQRSITVLVILILSAVQFSRPQQDPCAMKFGMNFIYLSYWNREMPFVDLMKLSSLWLTQNSVYVTGGTNRFDTAVRDSIPADENGYPLQLPYSVAGQETTQIVMALLASQQNALYPAGEYLCLYEGDGTITFTGDASVVSQTPGRIVLNVVPSNAGIMLRITRSTFGNHVRNVRMLMPGTESTYLTQPFNSAFLAKIAPFPVLRFMWWQFVTDGNEVSWQNRKRMSYYTQGSYFSNSRRPSGIAYEYLVHLGNQLNKDIWVCVPHTADSAYVAEMALFFKTNLDPGRKIYLEFSNEAWNYIYRVHQWVNQNGPAHLNHPQKTAYFVKRTFDIWSSVFGQEMSSRVIRVAACQLTLPWVGQQMMAYLGPGGADAIAPAAYYVLRPENYDTLEAKGASATKDDVARMIRSHFPVLGGMMRDHQTLADQYGLKLVFYEGGGEIRPRNVNNPSTQAIYAYQTDTAAYNVHQEWFRTIRAVSDPELFVYFHLASRANDRNEGYGALESIFLPTSPKYQVLLDNICGPATGVPLAVELTHFSGAVQYNNRVVLYWTTAGEVDNVGFDVERMSYDRGAAQNGRWHSVGFVEGHGTTDSAHEYMFVDTGADPARRNVFRLRQIDRNGAFTYSPETVVDGSTTPGILSLHQNYPNPFNPATAIKYSVPEDGDVKLTVYDITGREVLQLVDRVQKAGTYTVTLSGADLASGVYCAVLSSGAMRRSITMVLLK